jgi:1-deoxy-D-xylulose-5-phosphate reductoisomerase
VPDRSTFECLGLAYSAGRAGGTAPAILSGANEIAVEAFLDGRIVWTDIARVVDEVLNGGSGTADEIADVLDADRRARERAAAVVAARSAA